MISRALWSFCTVHRLGAMMFVGQYSNRDFESDIYNVRIRICKRHHLYKNIEILTKHQLMKMYKVRGDPQVFRATSLLMIDGISSKHHNADLFIRTCAVHNNIKTMFKQGGEECLCNGNFAIGMTFLRQVAEEDHIETIYLLGMIYISRGLQLLDAYFGWAVPDHGEYIGVVDSAKDLLKTFTVVYIVTTNNITFQCEEELHSV
uniref:At2g35280-like TPR domain-containing protein n=1 Tax=Lactuca sativa TaxID=4236 RepID=A0A9R1VLW6_LACSA|nr:hypothetical protein LSAT_V11C400208090 [Lactuca sativa]